MISYLKGTVLTKKNKYLILLVNNIGYQIFINAKTLNSLEENQDISIYIHHHVTENSQELYGFSSLPELELFKNLISISGVGPKSAINVLATSSVEDVIQAILSEDPALLKTVSGIGTKTAERIVVELKSKIGSMYKDLTGSDIKVKSKDMEIIEALLGLGYSRSETMNTIKQIPADITEASQRLKAALKLLAK